MIKAEEKRTSVDWLMISAVFVLMCIGAAFIYSAIGANENRDGTAFYRLEWFKQIIWYLVGAAGAAVFCLVSYHTWARFSIVFYWLVILLLVALFIPGVGKTIYGATRWIDLKVFQLQPSEFAKLALILAGAHFLSRPPDELRMRKVFLQSLGMIFLPFVLILKEPDLGSALILLPIGFIMMYVAGTPLKYLQKFIGGMGLLVVLLLVDILFAPPKWQIKLEEYQRHRLLVFFGKDFAPKDATPAQKLRARELQRSKSYNIEQALITVGSGGLVGKGWQNGTQTALGFLPRPVAHNDFLFSVIAEEKGFLGSLVVLLLYAAILFSGIRIASEARDRLGRIMAAGVIALLFSHVFINIGMNIRIMPVTGVPLPLLSYGGSSVICSLVALGILQNVHIYRKAY